jgi:hypothetical protein
MKKAQNRQRQHRLRRSMIMRGEEAFLEKQRNYATCSIISLFLQEGQEGDWAKVIADLRDELAWELSQGALKRPDRCQ